MNASISDRRPIIRDVTLRDGLQLAQGSLSTTDKLHLARTLLADGIDCIEIGAAVRPDRVPAMADTFELVGMLDDDEREKVWVLVPNLKGAQRAVEAGVRNIEYVLSVTDSHNRANVGRDTEASVAEIPAISDLVHGAGGTLQVSLSTAFTCPFEGEVDPSRVVALLNESRMETVDSVALCDTIGQATPAAVASLTRTARERFGDDRWLFFHGHDTWGQGVANSIAALENGADTVDAALGGLGGCPFAPGASGNTATEDLLYALRPGWLTPERFRSLVQASLATLDTLGEPQRSRAADAATRTSGPHPWSVR
ncbi:MAG TPA: hydroxymethylglutaryl-CoA lyase [Thermomicrobiales bacterium]|nr:hydroxymethylglutaryl-CoA lyase [Thermomicrobiales bacterium]